MVAIDPVEELRAPTLDLVGAHCRESRTADVGEVDVEKRVAEITHAELG